ncbi:MAG TPA: MFS transporter [Ktedonobacteraceae bacterium]
MTRWWVIVAAGLAVFMASVDLSITNVALPTLGHFFAVPPAALEWVVLAYSLPAVALLLPLGRWVDTVALRGAFLLAVCGFAAASVLCGLAPSLPWLVICRFLQGGFGALISALVLPLAASAIRPEQRGRAMGVIGALGPLGAVAGPGLGGLLLASLGWRSIFFVNVPVCLVAVLIGTRSIPGPSRLTLPKRAWIAQAMALSIAVLALFVALTQAAAERPSYVAVCILLSVALLATFVWARLPESRHVTRVLSKRPLALSVGALALFATVGGALNYLPPFFLQNDLHATPQAIGVTVLVRGLVMGAIAPLGGFLADRWGTRPLSLLAALCVGAGLLSLLPLDTGWSPLDVAWRLGLLGLGMGLFSGPNQSAIMGFAPRQVMGTVSGLSGLGRNLGFALGPALATIVWTLSGSGLLGIRAGLLLLLALTGCGALLVASVRSAPHRVVAPSTVAPVAAREESGSQLLVK